MILITIVRGAEPPAANEPSTSSARSRVSTHRPGTFGALIVSCPWVDRSGLERDGEQVFWVRSCPLRVPIVGLEQVPQGADRRLPPGTEGLGGRRRQPLGICPVHASGVHDGRVEIERLPRDHRLRLLDDDQPAAPARHVHDGRRPGRGSAEAPIGERQGDLVRARLGRCRHPRPDRLLRVAGGGLPLLRGGLTDERRHPIRDPERRGVLDAFHPRLDLDSRQLPVLRGLADLPVDQQLTVPNGRLGRGELDPGERGSLGGRGHHHPQATAARLPCEGAQVAGRDPLALPARRREWVHHPELVGPSVVAIEIDRVIVLLALLLPELGCPAAVPAGQLVVITEQHGPAAGSDTSTHLVPRHELATFGRPARLEPEVAQHRREILEVRTLHLVAREAAQPVLRHRDPSGRPLLDEHRRRRPQAVGGRAAPLALRDEVRVVVGQRALRFACGGRQGGRHQEREGESERTEGARETSGQTGVRSAFWFVPGRRRVDRGRPRIVWIAVERSNRARRARPVPIPRPFTVKPPGVPVVPLLARASEARTGRRGSRTCRARRRPVASTPSRGRSRDPASRTGRTRGGSGA